jgi:hypothetical protein
MAEVLSKRTAHQKVYDDVPGERTFRAEIHAGEIHYLDQADSWQDVDGLMDGATFRSKDKRVQFGITNGYMGAWIPGGPHLGFRPWKIAYYESTTGKRKALEDADYSNASLDGNIGTIHDVYPGSIDLQVQFAPRRMRKRYRLPSLPNLPDPSTPSIGMDPANTYLVFGYDVDNTSNLTFHRGDTDEPFPTGELVHADVVMKDAQGDERLRLMQGEAISATKYVVPVYYLRTAQIPFGEAIAYSDLQAATYPLIVDPSTTVYAGTEDGQITDGSSVDTSSTSHEVGAVNVGKGDDDVYRYYCRFDLSAIDSGATCDTATLDLYATSSASSGSGTITPKLYDTDWGPTLTSGDYGQSGTDQGTLAISSWSNVTYHSFNLTESDVEDWFGAASYCSFEVRGPTSAGNWVRFNSADNTNDPKLSITYTEGGGGVDVTPGSDALSVTGQSPALKHGHVLGAGLDALSLTGQSPTVSATAGSVGVDVTAGFDALVLSGQTATHTKTDNQSVAAGYDALILSGQTATVTATSVVDVNVTAGNDALVLTGQAASHTKTDNQSVQVGSDALSLAGQTATHAKTDNHVLEAGADALVLTGQAATVTKTDNQSVAAGAGSVTLTGQAAVAQVGNVINQVVPVGAGALSLTGQIATHSKTDNQAVSVGNDALVLAGQAATATSTSNLSVQAGADALVLTGQAASHSKTDNATLSAGSDALVLSGQTATVSATTVGDVTVTAQAGSIALAGQVATATKTDNQTLAANSGAVSLTGQAPAVSVTTVGNVSVSAAAGTVSLSGQSPTIDTTATGIVGAGAGTITLSGLAPVLEHGHELGITAGSIAIGGQAPNAYGDFGATADADALALSGQAPTFDSTDNILAAPGSGAITLSGQTSGLVLDEIFGVRAGSISLTGKQPVAFVQQIVPALTATSNASLNANIANRSASSDRANRSLDADIAGRSAG